MPEYDDDGNPIENDPVRQQREHIEQLEAQVKAAKAAEKERDLLKAQVEKFQGEKKKADVEAILTSEEIKGKASWAGLYLSHNPEGEVTPEAVKTWLTSVDLMPTAPEPATPEPAAAPAAWSPTIGGTPSGSPSQVTRKEFDEIMLRDPDGAAKLIKENRVIWNHPQAQRASLAGAREE